MHSTASDGSDAPERLPALAAEAGLSAIALTDHDTTAGLEACEAAAAEQGITFVPGIELSADPASIETRAARDDAPSSAPRGTLHILGYFVRRDDPSLTALQNRLREARAQRNPEMIQKLRELGVAITHEQVQALAEAEQTRAPGRPHIAQLLVQKGYVKSVHEAFSRYIGQDGAAYVRKDRLTAGEAIEAIHKAGGLASLAHPVQLELSDDALEHAVARLADLGLDAIEIYHSDHERREVQAFEHLAERFRLCTTGGSDYHGTRKRIALGSQHVPLSIYEQLQAAWAHAEAM
jgi:predicted metal-dependent phosphoesterase TrpH